MHAWGLRLRRDVTHSRYRTPPYCLPVGVTPSAPHIPVFGAQWPACIYPSPTLQVQPHDCPRMARGQDGSLHLSCMTLTFTAPRRFIPTLSTPARVIAAHHPDQIADLLRHAGPTWLAAADSPLPAQAKAFTMPGDNGFSLEDHPGGFPLAPQASQTHPEDPVGWRRLQAFWS